MESIEQDNAAPPLVTNVPIEELLKIGFRENEAVELHSAKISFPKIQ